jgi:hypothetical protein
VTQIRRYDSLGSPDPESREATTSQLNPYRAKVFRARRPSDRDDFLAALAPAVAPDRT